MIFFPFEKLLVGSSEQYITASKNLLYYQKWDIFITTGAITGKSFFDWCKKLEK